MSEVGAVVAEPVNAEKIAELLLVLLVDLSLGEASARASSALAGTCAQLVGVLVGLSLGEASARASTIAQHDTWAQLVGAFGWFVAW